MFGRRKHRDPDEGSAVLHAAEAMATIDDDNFLSATEGGFTVVDFWAPWCGPCRAFAPVFAEVAVHTDERIRFARCNVDQSPVTANMLQIRSIPTVIAFGPDGSEVRRVVGLVRRADLERVVAELENQPQT